MSATPKTIRIVDSHTGGEPTRLIIAGGPDLGRGSMAERLETMRNKFDRFRPAVVNEPRGADAMVGALLCEPVDTSCAAGVIFFNNVGYLGMCGHGTMGLVASLQHLGRIGPGLHRIETPVGVVTAELFADGQVAVENVPSYRFAKDVEFYAKGYPFTMGDIAWGGNWFFLTEETGPIQMSCLDGLMEYAVAIREGLETAGIRGADGAVIDHVELFSETGRNFVLCPGKAYDRSPCGTGTSAKMACLYADGKLKPGEIWRQESIVGSVFEGWLTVTDGIITPTIRGSAFVNGEATLILDDRDPFCWGIPH